MQPIADTVGVNVDEAARGIYRIVTANIAEAIREVTVKRGTDPRDFALVAFGGAGGQHAAAVAREMEMKEVVFPRNASTFSAFGLLTADLKNSAAKSLMVALSRADETIGQDFRALERTAREFLDNSKTAIEQVYADWWADVRYVGQSHEVPVPVPPGPVGLERLYADFERLHERLYGTKLEDDAEIVNIRVTVTGQVSRLKAPQFQPDEIHTAPIGERLTGFAQHPVPIFWRDGLPPGWRHTGACLIEERDFGALHPRRHHRRGSIRQPSAEGETRCERRCGRATNEAGLDPFSAEILRNYLLSTVKEMVSTTVRTAYSTCFSEGEDFTCGLFDRDGNMIAQAAGINVHAGGLTLPVRHFLEKFGHFEPGDVVIHNDPYTGATHQGDGAIFRPMFYEKTLVGFSVNRGHWTDIGGMAPGGWAGTASHVVQEALRIPATKLYRAGVLATEIRDLIEHNIRFARQWWGDVQAQIASNITAERRLQTLIRRYGLDVVLSSFSAAIDYSRRRFLKAMEAIPNTSVAANDIYMEDDGFGDGLYRCK